jgi:hypothetical protein
MAMDKWTIIYETLSASELEQVSDLSTGMQRVWRQRGYLPPIERGHARFDLRTAASVMVRQALSQRGLSPAESAEHGDLAAPMVIFSALMDADGACEVVGEPHAVTAFADAYLKDTSLISKLAGVDPGGVRRYMLAFEDDPPELDDDLGSVIDASGAASGCFINLLVLGERLADRLRRPLIRVELDGPVSDPAVRRRQVRRLMHVSGRAG